MTSFMDKPKNCSWTSGYDSQESFPKRVLPGYTPKPWTAKISILLAAIKIAEPSFCASTRPFFFRWDELHDFAVTAKATPITVQRAEHRISMEKHVFEVE